MIKDIDIPIFNTRVLLIYQEDLSIMTEYCDDTFDHDAGVTVFFDENKLVVGFKPSLFRQSILAHESVHMAHRIMDNVAISHSLMEDECEAYLTGYISRTLLEAIEEHHDELWHDHVYNKNFAL